jgi:putative Mg2+ transporter-C (MgtC) family protein
MVAGMPLETVRIDPTRMAQGIMTGIGFLGAGVVLKDGLTVRGLTTAASIWITAAIGIMVGGGFYFAAIAGTLVTLGALSVFRRIELIMPALYYSRLEIRYRRNEVLSEDDLRAFIAGHGFSVANLSYALKEEGKFFEYTMVIRTGKLDDTRRLAEALTVSDKVLEFRITPAGD